MDVLIEPDETARRIRDYVRSNLDLIYDRCRPDEVSLSGGCYVLSETYYHAQGGRESNFDIYCLSWNDVFGEKTDSTHWFLRDTETGDVVDLSLDRCDQAEHIPFDAARRRSFRTGYDHPSKRTKSVLVDLEIPWEIQSTDE